VKIAVHPIVLLRLHQGGFAGCAAESLSAYQLITLHHPTPEDTAKPKYAAPTNAANTTKQTTLANL